MGFVGTKLELSKGQFSYCPELREQFKLILNSMLGKLAQKPSEEVSCLVKSPAQLRKIAANSVILNVGTVNNTYCELELLKKKDEEDRKGNSVVYAFVTARARITLHTHVMRLASSNFRVFYTDTDSIIFSGPRFEKPPIPMGIAFGDFKDELGPNCSIKKFFCRGRKNFEIMYERDSKRESLVKIKGLSLKSNIAKTIVLDRVNDSSPSQWPREIRVPQMRRRNNKICHQLFDVKMKTNCQRKVKEDLHCLTLPWGYNEQ